MSAYDLRLCPRLRKGRASVRTRGDLVYGPGCRLRFTRRLYYEAAARGATRFTACPEGERSLKHRESTSRLRACRRRCGLRVLEGGGRRRGSGRKRSWSERARPASRKRNPARSTRCRSRASRRRSACATRRGVRGFLPCPSVHGPVPRVASVPRSGGSVDCCCAIGPASPSRSRDRRCCGGAAWRRRSCWASAVRGDGRLRAHAGLLADGAVVAGHAAGHGYTPLSRLVGHE